MSAEVSFARVGELERLGARAALVTVVRTSGSTPRASGARMVVHADGTLEGTVGGGRVEQEAAEIAQDVLSLGVPRYLELKLTQELGMCCGGQVALFIEPINRAPTLVVYGAGHVGLATAAAAQALGFQVHVVDERVELLTAARFPEARRRIAIFNCRADRADRSRQLGEACATWSPADHYVAIGTGTYIFARAAEAAGLDGNRIVFAESHAVHEIFELVVELAGRSALVMGMGNIGGQGLDLVSYFKNRSVLTAGDDEVSV